MTTSDIHADSFQHAPMAPHGNRIFKNKNNDWAVHTEIEIDATPDQVWAVMTDFDALPEWSSGLQSFDGELRDGSEGRIVFRVNRFFKLDLVRPIKANTKMFGWVGPLFFGLYADDHEYRVEPLDGGRRTRFIQTDLASGPMGKIIGRLVVAFDKRVFAEFNKQLKARVEQPVQQG